MDKTRACCFSGHRSVHFDMDFSHMGYVFQGVLKKAIQQAIADGYRFFYGGLARGFDIIAAEVVIKEKYSRNDVDLTIISVAPFRGHELKWGQPWRERHDAVLKASEIQVLNDRFIQGCYHERNRHMVDNSSRLIGFYSGKSGGTKHTFDYARDRGIDIVNIWDEVQWLDPMRTKNGHL
ncbi:MAG: SLOG family protein [Defluviitaleaceae bacterium]|nr:SLOG family protein [Defluviitaleaceae bacterium]